MYAEKDEENGSLLLEEDGFDDDIAPSTESPATNIQEDEMSSRGSDVATAESSDQNGFFSNLTKRSVAIGFATVVLVIVIIILAVTVPGRNNDSKENDNTTNPPSSLTTSNSSFNDSTSNPSSVPTISNSQVLVLDLSLVSPDNVIRETSIASESSDAAIPVEITVPQETQVFLITESGSLPASSSKLIIDRVLLPDDTPSNEETFDCPPDGGIMIEAGETDSSLQNANTLIFTFQIPGDENSDIIVCSNENEFLAQFSHQIHGSVLTPGPTATPTPIPTTIMANPTAPPGTPRPTISPTDIPSSEPSHFSSTETSPPFSPRPTQSPTDMDEASPGLPSFSPTNLPSKDPTSSPTPEPTSGPTSEDGLSDIETTPSPTESPTTSSPTPGPTSGPSTEGGSWDGEPTESPTPEPTASPTPAPILAEPTNTPSGRPSDGPTISPIATEIPSSRHSFSPTTIPSILPTIAPVESAEPSNTPTSRPSDEPTKSPITTDIPSSRPSFSPTRLPTFSPTRLPTFSPTRRPSVPPSVSPTRMPTRIPSVSPTHFPSEAPTFTIFSEMKSAQYRISASYSSNCGQAGQDIIITCPRGIFYFLDDSHKGCTSVDSQSIRCETLDPIDVGCYGFSHEELVPSVEIETSVSFCKNILSSKRYSKLNP